MNKVIVIISFHIYLFQHIAQMLTSFSEYSEIATFLVNENTPFGHTVGHLFNISFVKSRFENTTFPMNKIVFDKLCEGKFMVDDRGHVIVAGIINREDMCPQVANCQCKIRFFTYGKTGGNIFSVVVVIMDVNDNYPVFKHPKKIISFSELSKPGTKVELDKAEDIDYPINTALHYSITGSGNEKFGVEHGDGEPYIALRAFLDYEAQNEYQFTVHACDVGNLCATQLLEVQVTDENDNSPVFVNAEYYVSIPEHILVNSVILQVEALDDDSGENGYVTYYLIKETQHSDNSGIGYYFTVREKSGEIVVLQKLDYMISSQFSLIIEARDAGVIRRSKQCLVKIDILDFNNHSPKINVKFLGDTKNGKVLIQENKQLTEPQTYVAHVLVSDNDDMNTPGGRHHCILLNSSNFQLNQVSKLHKSTIIYGLSPNVVFDREKQGTFDVIVACSDEAISPMQSSATISVIIQDVNEFAPRFSAREYFFNISENTPDGFIVSELNVFDKDSDHHFYFSLDNFCERYFYVNVSNVNYLMTNNENLDRETIQNLVCNITVWDVDKLVNNIVFSDSVIIKIKVLDQNDNIPTGQLPNIAYDIQENYPIGSTIGKIEAFDNDIGINALINFKLQRVTADGIDQDLDIFKVLDNGSFHCRKLLDRETHNEYHLEIIIYDSGIPPLSSTITITLVIVDINDNIPQWFYPTKSDNSKNVSLSPIIGTLVTRIFARDPDFNSNITYEIINNSQFSVHNTKGEVRTAKLIPAGSYKLIFKACDNDNPPLHSFIDFYLHVIHITEKLAETNSSDYMSVTLLVCLFVGSGIVCVILVISIVCVVRHAMHVKRNDRNKNDKRSDCRPLGSLDSPQMETYHISNGPGWYHQANHVFIPAELTKPVTVCANKSNALQVSNSLLDANTGRCKDCPAEQEFECDMISSDSGQGASVDHEHGCNNTDKKMLYCMAPNPRLYKVVLESSLSQVHNSLQPVHDNGCHDNMSTTPVGSASTNRVMSHHNDYDVQNLSSSRNCSPSITNYSLSCIKQKEFSL